MMGIGQSQWYSYRCQDCGFETEVEDIIVDSFAILACPECEGTMHEIDNESPPEGR
jgi:predicted nucleic acid-binding Zn ribbon protein